MLKLQLESPYRSGKQALAQRTKNFTIVVGDPQGNVDQTWINYIKKRAKAKRILEV